jgi:hypothetical protein
VRDLYISRIGQPILLQTHVWKLGLRQRQFPEKEYINVIFLAVKMSDLGARELTSREGGGHNSWPADPLLRETIDLRSGLLNPLGKFLDLL